MLNQTTGITPPVTGGGTVTPPITILPTPVPVVAVTIGPPIDTSGLVQLKNVTAAATVLASYAGMPVALAQSLMPLIQADTKNRNYQGTQWEKLRYVVDPVVGHLHDTLEISHLSWMAGKSNPWCGFDVLATPALSQTQFDQLIGCLYHLYTIAMVDYNTYSIPSNLLYDNTQLNYIDPISGLSQTALAQNWITASGINTAPIQAVFLQYIPVTVWTTT